MGWVWLAPGSGGLGFLVGEAQRHGSESGSSCPAFLDSTNGRQATAHCWRVSRVHAGTRALRFCLVGSAGSHRHWQAPACSSVKATGQHRNTNWAVVSALFRKSSYRFKRAAGPCSGRYVSRHPRGRRRWPASGRGMHWDKIVDWENKLGTIGRWR